MLLPLRQGKSFIYLQYLHWAAVFVLGLNGEAPPLSGERSRHSVCRIIVRGAKYR